MAFMAMRELPDYVMAPGSPDLLGWAVCDRDGHLAGVVVDVVVDTDHDEVRLIGARLGDGTHVLVNVAALDLNEDRGSCKVFGLTREELHAQPPYAPPTLSADVARRYDELFRHEEPIGAWEPSPLDIPFPPLRARGDRLRHPPFGRKPKEPVMHQVHLPHLRTPESTETPVKAGIFAASMPWDIADVGHEVTPDRPGPAADTEVLWQAEQPGMRSAMGGSRPKHEEEE